MNLTPYIALSLTLQENQNFHNVEECLAWAMRTAKHLAEKKRAHVSIPCKDGGRTTLHLIGGEWSFVAATGGNENHAEIMLAAGNYYKKLNNEVA